MAWSLTELLSILFFQDENGSKGYFEVTLSVKEMDAKPFRKGLQRAKIMTHKVAKERNVENSVLSPMRGQSLIPFIEPMKYHNYQ